MKLMPIIDGDILCYRVGFACNEETEKVAIRTMADMLEELIFIELSSNIHVGYLTGKDNYRHDIAKTKPYKGNRKDAPRPVHLHSLREYLITLTYPGVTDPTVIEVTDVCEMGGFAYTRTVIPQSCGVKFADGTIMNTAVTASGTTGTAMNYTQGLLSPQVESDFISLPDTITTDGGQLFNTYKLGGIATFDAPGTSAYSYLIGVISGDDKLRLINDATVIGAKGVTTYAGVSGKFTVNALVKNASTGAAIPLTFATIVLDNTIASLNDYFVSIVAISGAPWNGTAYIDIEFMSDQVLAYYN